MVVHGPAGFVPADLPLEVDVALVKIAGDPGIPHVWVDNFPKGQGIQPEAAPEGPPTGSRRMLERGVGPGTQQRLDAIIQNLQLKNLKIEN